MTLNTVPGKCNFRKFQDHMVLKDRRLSDGISDLEKNLVLYNDNVKAPLID